MPTPSSNMRIEFQLTLADWIEWKRANLSKQRLVVLILAETSLIPLVVVCALTIVLAWLRYVPGWLPIVILSLIALGQIYLSCFSRFRRRFLKDEWLNEIADETITIETNPDGFDYFSNKVSYKPTWNEVASVYQTKLLLMFWIPTRARQISMCCSFLNMPSHPNNNSTNSWIWRIRKLLPTDRLRNPRRRHNNVGPERRERVS